MRRKHFVREIVLFLLQKNDICMIFRVECDGDVNFSMFRVKNRCFGW